MQILRFNKAVRTLAAFVVIGSVFIALMVANIKKPFGPQVDEASKQLITVSGILTALSFAVLMPKAAERSADRQQKLALYRKKSKKLAAFRSFARFLAHVSLFQGKVGALSFEYIKSRSFGDYREDYAVWNEIEQRINDGNIDVKDFHRFELYAILKDFSFDHNFFKHFRKNGSYDFALKRLVYVTECCGWAWYKLDHNRYLLGELNDSFVSFAKYFREEAIELTKYFSIGKVKLRPDGSNVGEFLKEELSEYDEFLRQAIKDLEEILYELSPVVFRPLLIDLLFIFCFGVITPLTSLVFNFSAFQRELLCLVDVSVTGAFIATFLVDVLNFFTIDWVAKDLEDDGYPLHGKY